MKRVEKYPARPESRPDIRFEIDCMARKPRLKLSGDMLIITSANRDIERSLREFLVFDRKGVLDYCGSMRSILSRLGSLVRGDDSVSIYAEAMRRLLDRYEAGLIR